MAKKYIPMIERMEAAKKRRAKYYAEYEKSGFANGFVAVLARKYKLSPGRMSQLLLQAKEEA